MIPLIASKIAPPRHRAEIIDRPRVTARLDRDVPVTLVSAPAGYGKTVAVAGWLRDRPAAWVSLDAADNDPVRLWSYVAAALDAPAPEGALEVGIEALGADDVPLVLEDVHVITDPRCLSTLAHATRVFRRLVLITRADPPIKLPRLRIEGVLNEVRADTLAFTVDEAAQVLGGGDPVAINARAEGWPAAVYFVALWLREGGDPRRLPADYLSEYVATEVLDAMAPDDRRFLVCTSVLPRLSAELCDHALERDDARDRLEALLHANLFLVALDEGWYRYHDLFRELLARSLPAQDAAALHRRAAAWFRARGLAEEAAEHAIAAGEHRMLAELIDEHHLPLIRSGRGTTIARWLAHLPEAELTARPSVLLSGAAAASGLARPRTEIMRLVAAAKRARAERPDAWTAYHETGLQVVLSVAGDDDVGAAVEAGQAAVAAAAREEGGELSVLAHAALANARLLAGDNADAARAAEAAIGHPGAQRRVHGYANALATLAIVRAGQRRLLSARELVDEALEVMRATGNTGVRAHGRAHAADAVVARAEGRLDHAAYAAERALALLSPGAFAARTRVELAGIRVARGELARAEEELTSVRDLLAECVDGGIVPRLADAVAATLDAARARVRDRPAEPLSSAERNVLEQLSTPRSIKQIGAALFLSPNTVKTHRRAIYRKLGAHSRDEAVRRATELGWL